jgi:uncharacterized protein
MSTALLPSQIDIRKLVVKGAEISAQTPISSLPRIEGLLASSAGSIHVSLQFYLDEQHIRRVDGELSGSVVVSCQRCLQPVQVEVDTTFTLGIVWSEEDAERLPNWLDPLIVGEELVNLADIVSDELILGLPSVNYHQPADCKQDVGFSSIDPDAAAFEEAAAEEKENPFQILEKLKLDK